MRKLLTYTQRAESLFYLNQEIASLNMEIEKLWRNNDKPTVHKNFMRTVKARDKVVEKAKKIRALNKEHRRAVKEAVPVQRAKGLVLASEVLYEALISQQDLNDYVRDGVLHPVRELDTNWYPIQELKIILEQANTRLAQSKKIKLHLTPEEVSLRSGWWSTARKVSQKVSKVNKI